MPLFFFDLCQGDAKVKLGTAEFEDSILAQEYANGLVDVVFGRTGPFATIEAGTIVISDADYKEIGQVRSDKK